MRELNRHYASRERARKTRILREHFQGWYWPKKPWKAYRWLLMTEPGWWTREFHTRPARIRANALCHSVVRGRNPDTILWPDARKPRLYYW